MVCGCKKKGLDEGVDKKEFLININTHFPLKTLIQDKDKGRTEDL